MKIDKLCGERFKEKHSDCVIDSHALMLRGGYMKGVANGIYSSFMPLRRITRKIENIIREEMDAIDGQEVQFPVVMPASLWAESGRYESIGSELMRFKDRNDSPMVLGMTLEDAGVGDADELGVVQVINGCSTTIAHAAAEAAYELVDDLLNRAFVGHAACDAFGHELLGVLDVPLEVAVFASALHCLERTHAAIALELSAVVDDGIARAFLCAGNQ